MEKEEQLTARFDKTKATIDLRESKYNGIAVTLDGQQVECLPHRLSQKNPSAFEVYPQKATITLSGNKDLPLIAGKPIYEAFTPKNTQGLTWKKLTLREKKGGYQKVFENATREFQEESQVVLAPSVLHLFYFGILQLLEILEETQGKEQGQALFDRILEQVDKNSSYFKKLSPEEMAMAEEEAITRAEDTSQKREKPQAPYDQVGCDKNITKNNQTIRKKDSPYRFKDTNTPANCISRFSHFLEVMNTLPELDEKAYELELELSQKLTGKDQSNSLQANEFVAESALFLEMKQLIFQQDHKQLILTGAPGTGKTYLSKQLVYHYLLEELQNKLYQYYSNRKKTQEDFPLLHEIISNLLTDTRPYQQEGARDLWVLGKDGVKRTLQEEEVARLCEPIDLFFQEEGGYTPEDFWRDVESMRGTMAFVQFHPSYDYSDFVDGIRPVVNDKEEIVFRRLDGAFISFCRYVAWRNEISLTKEEKYFFLIDEINRADLSKVLGELMFCLEQDKRGRSNAVHTQYQNLSTYFPKEYREISAYCSCFQNGFFVPENIVVIGTMNDIDRSVESIDFALRRRFAWKEVVVTRELLENAFLHGKMFDTYVKNYCDFSLLSQEEQENQGEKLRLALTKSVIKIMAKKVCDFNQECLRKNNLDRGYDIAQGQFSDCSYGEEGVLEVRREDFRSLEKGSWDISKNHPFLQERGREIALKILQWAWNHRVAGLLTEYLRGRHHLEAEKKAMERQWFYLPPVSQSGSVLPQDSDTQSLPRETEEE